MDSFDLDLQHTIRGYAPGNTVFGRFTLQRIVGRGGMGVVWLAHDEKLNREIALKFLPDIVRLDKGALNELKNETKRCLELTHPNIVRIYDLASDEASAAIAMEYVDGDTLASIRADQPNGCLETSAIEKWLPQLAKALQHAHAEAGIVHCDIKPGNLMLSEKGALKLTDFGISRNLNDSVSRISLQTSSGGTIAYMSPQQAMGSVPTVKDDIYATGATLYELITGKPPFFSGDILAQLERKAPPSMQQRRAEFGQSGEPISEAWEAAVAACLAKDPAQRPESIEQIIAAIMADRIWTATPAPASAAELNSGQHQDALSLELDDYPTLAQAPIPPRSRRESPPPLPSPAATMPATAPVTTTPPISNPPTSSRGAYVLASLPDAGVPASTPPSLADKVKSMPRGQQIKYAAIAAVALLALLLLGNSLLGSNHTAQWAEAQAKFQSAYQQANHTATDASSAAEKMRTWDSFLNKNGDFDNPHSEADNEMLARARANAEIFKQASVAEAAKQQQYQQRKQDFTAAYDSASAAVKRVGSAREKTAVWQDFIGRFGDFRDPDSSDDDVKIAFANTALNELKEEVNAEQSLDQVRAEFEQLQQDAEKLPTLSAKREAYQNFLVESIPVISGKSSEIADLQDQVRANLERLRDIELAEAANSAANTSPGHQDSPPADSVTTSALAPAPTDAASHDSAANRPTAVPLGNDDPSAGDAAVAPVAAEVGAAGMGTDTPLADPASTAAAAAAAGVSLSDPSAEPTPAASIDEMFQPSKYDDYGSNAKRRVLMSVQTKLKEAGLYNSSIDGKKGPGTHKALVEYQKNHQLVATGRLDEASLMRMALNDEPANNADFAASTPTQKRSSPSNSGRRSAPTPASGPGFPGGMDMNQMREKMRRMMGR